MRRSVCQSATVEPLPMSRHEAWRILRARLLASQRPPPRRLLPSRLDWVPFSRGAVVLYLGFVLTAAATLLVLFKAGLVDRVAAPLIAIAAAGAVLMGLHALVRRLWPRSLYARWDIVQSGQSRVIADPSPAARLARLRRSYPPMAVPAARRP